MLDMIQMVFFTSTEGPSILAMRELGCRVDSLTGCWANSQETDTIHVFAVPHKDFQAVTEILDEQGLPWRTYKEFIANFA